MCPGFEGAHISRYRKNTLKKKKKNLILQHAPALFFSWLIVQAATALFLFLGLPEPPLSICF